ncbi:MAG: tRNA uracil 4-sulfurtransferase ThiI [Thermoplasmata archaeon]
MIIIRYDEIGLKGKNRIYFENRLIENIKNQIKKSGYESHVERIRGRIIVDSQAPLNVYSKIFGIRSYSPAIESSLDLDEIYNSIRNLILERKFKTFRISTQRLWKGYEKTSMGINEKIGEFVIRDFSKKVDLEKPDLNIGIEILNDRSYIFTEKYQGPGGLPYAIEGKVLMLISGGIDSPVAAYLLMKRGADLTFLHYKTNDEILKKVKNLINIIESYAPKSLDLIVEDHRDLLKDVIINLESMRERKWTCVFCRYSMLKRAEEIARGIGALAIGTGESLGQVASQTLNNISVENLATNMPVLRPLIGLDKIEIENIAIKIGTFNASISIKGCGCPFLPIHPITSASIEKFIKLRDKALKPAEKEYSEVFEKNRC